MAGAARRWAELLDAWTIPDDILFQAPEDPWTLEPEWMAAPRHPQDTPSRRLAMEALPPGGRILDIGCGGGAASLALVPPGGWIVGLDSSPRSLDAFRAACRSRGVPFETVQGEWPVAAAAVDPADIVVCHNVAYNVRDILAFVVELTGRARYRVVVELAAAHPSAALAPLWRYFWKLDRPHGPSAGDFLAVVTEAGIDPVVEQFPGRSHVRSPESAVALARRRLCLPAAREAEVAAGLKVLPKTPTDRWTFAWPGDA
jgi:SAM-dependent methyltransferase